MSYTTKRWINQRCSTPKRAREMKQTRVCLCFIWKHGLGQNQYEPFRVKMDKKDESKRSRVELSWIESSLILLNRCLVSKGEGKCNAEQSALVLRLKRDLVEILNVKNNFVHCVSIGVGISLLNGNLKSNEKSSVRSAIEDVASKIRTFTQSRRLYENRPPFWVRLFLHTKPDLSIASETNFITEIIFNRWKLAKSYLDVAKMCSVCECGNNFAKPKPKSISR